MERTVFISHSSQDTHVADMIYKRLGELGISCWYDRAELDADALQGSSYARAIVEAIDEASVFIAVISEAAARSPDVKNEVDLAHKRVAQGMILVPFRLMQEDLREELRYYFARTNIVDGRVPPLAVRVNSLCELVRDAVAMLRSDDSPVALQTQLGDLDYAPSLGDSHAVDHALQACESRDVSRALAGARRELDAFYRKRVDPYETYRHYNDMSALACPLPLLVERLYERGTYSFALGELLLFVSYFLINDGKVAYVQKARGYLQKALTVFERMYDSSPDQADEATTNIIFCQWLLAVTHKQERNFGLAEQVLTGLLLYAEAQYESYELPYSKTVLLPKRELAIIRADGDSFDFLVDNMELYADDPKEMFYTLRRAFEYYCFEQDFERASALKDRLLEAYERCSDELFGIYYYAMMMNVHQYYCQFGLAEEEGELYERLLPELRKNHFERYVDRLERDRASFVAGRRIRGYGENGR